MTILNTEYGPIVQEDTIKLFHNDHYLQSVESYIDYLIIHPKYGTCVVLSSTIFYPQGGGQKGDKGTIEFDSHFATRAGIPHIIDIIDTKKEGGIILHVTDSINTDTLNMSQVHENLLGTKVKVEINWNFRYKQMRLHSIAHLLHFISIQITNNSTLKFPEASDLNDGFGINRYNTVGIISDSDTVDIRSELLSFNKKGYEVKTYPNKDDETFRYWECNGNIVPCGGTHINTTSEIGDFSLTTKTRKGKTSLTFELN